VKTRLANADAGTARRSLCAAVQATAKPERTHEDGRGIDAANEAGALAHGGDHDLHAQDLQEKPGGKVPTTLRQPPTILLYVGTALLCEILLMSAPCLRRSVSCAQ